MRKRCLLLLLLLACLLTSNQSYATPDWMAKVDPWLLAQLHEAETAVSATPTGNIEFLVTLAAQADLSGAAALTDKIAKGAYVYERLTAVARASQPALLAQLDAAGAAYRPFWIDNVVWVRGDGVLLAAVARRADVAYVYGNPAVPLTLPPPEAALDATAVAGVEWNIAHINAPSLWALGVRGQGVVIGGQDTGYDWQHPALKQQYRGWNGTTASHDFNWHDAISSGGNARCGSNSPEPCDDYSSSHGTHTMGTMVGDDGGANQIGVAPDAQWIGCRNMNNGVGTPATYMACYEWFAAPYPLGGDPLTDGDPARAPHVINNSWSCPTYEGCTDPAVLLDVVDAVRTAGIVTVHSAGNSGSACSSVNTPAAIYDSSFTVGNTTSSDAISSRSSRGPVLVDGSGRLKPDVAAPGTGIRSSAWDGGYRTLSGTSMAGPHVAGLVALLISAEPSLAGQVDAIEAIIRQTAVPLTTTQGCGGDTATAVPNNVYGYGRIDALNAFTSLLPGRTFLPVIHFAVAQSQE